MIKYIFSLARGRVFEFEIDPDRSPEGREETENLPEWTRLSHRQCENCPLTEDASSHCPPAADLSDILPRFARIVSFERSEVRVETPERVYMKECDVQTSLNSLLGLVMATSQCPILSALRPLGHYHLPFSGIEETVFRTTGAYLLKQYFIARDGGEPDMELKQLRKLYKNLQILNQGFTKL